MKKSRGEMKKTRAERILMPMKMKRRGHEIWFSWARRFALDAFFPHEMAICLRLLAVFLFQYATKTPARASQRGPEGISSCMFNTNSYEKRFILLF